ncbi:hypothetical protein LOK49_LG14G01947 [Camellia lanceoleosa]|uniref:Uncharacterized protein n=1 Tax=Camellia lanceoleosa TaxID=1840588 RepID=A0ACC0FAT3_9ERIC|nr:hypothetical protein LOK49_LG14G01947 [Camellia lanceoleosa]
MTGKIHADMVQAAILLDHITVQLAPRAADEIWYGESQLSTIWAETADNARSAARTFVLGGLSEKHYGLSYFWVADRINILQQNRELMDAVVNELVQKKSLSKQEFFRLVELHGSLKPMPQSILDIRVAKRLQFQDMMMNQKESAIRGNV